MRCKMELVNTRRIRFGGDTPFLSACQMGQLEAASFLAEVAGIDLNAVNENGESAFHRACDYGHLEVVRFLAALPGFNVLHATNIYEQTGLHLAIESDHLHVVRFLLSSNLGFDTETRDTNNCTALHRAIMCNRLDIAEYLVSVHNADIQPIGHLNRSCLHWAVAKMNVKVVRYLLESFPVAVPGLLAATDDFGNTPLHHCKYGDDGEICRLLIQNGAQINARNIYGKTPLHGATYHLALAQEFIQHGADLLATDNGGNTPFDLAYSNITT